MQKRLITSLPTLFAVMSATPAFADSESLATAQFVVKQAEPSVGSRIRREVVRSTDIPINRRYDQLTTEEKGILFAKYESIDSADEPPFPKEGLQPILRNIVTGMRNARIDTEGTMKL